MNYRLQQRHDFYRPGISDYLEIPVDPAKNEFGLGETKQIASSQNPDLNPKPFFYAPGEIEKWLPNSKGVGPEQIPAMRPIYDIPRIERLLAFDKVTSAANLEGVAVMFYRSDEKLRQVWHSPKKQLAKVSQAAAVISPDFSLYFEMPRHQRIMSVRQSRAIGQLFGHHGITTIPNVRWANSDDFDFCFLGIEPKSIVAISTLGCIKSKEEKIQFRIGLKELLNTLEPTKVLVHGRMPGAIFDPYASTTEFLHYPADIDAKRGKDLDHGRW
jgi:hypothetical protein